MLLHHVFLVVFLSAAADGDRLREDEMVPDPNGYLPPDLVALCEDIEDRKAPPLRLPCDAIGGFPSVFVSLESADGQPFVIDERTLQDEQNLMVENKFIKMSTSRSSKSKTKPKNKLRLFEHSIAGHHDGACSPT